MNKRLSRNFAIWLAVLIGLVLVVSIGVWSRASAIDRNSITAKAVFEGVYGCFNGGAYRKTFYASDVSGFVLDAKSGNSVKLPYGFTDVGDNDLNCREVMLGYNNSSGIKGGLIPDNVRDAGASVTTVKNYFAGYSSNESGMPSAGAGATGTTGGIGYTAEAITEGTGGVAKTLAYTMADFQCASGETNPTFGGSKTTITFPTVIVTDSGLKITSANDIPASGASFTSTNCANLNVNISYSASGDQIVFEMTGDADATIYYNKRGSGELSITNQNLTLSNGGNWINFNPSIAESGTGSSTISNYKLTWGGGSAMDLIKGINANNRAGYKLAAISAGMGYGNLMLTKQEVFDLYTYYIENVFKAKLVAEGSSDYTGVDVNLCSSKKYKVNKTNAVDVGGVYGVDSNYHFTATVNLDSVIATLDKLGTFDDINNGGKCGTDPTPTPDPGNPGGGGSAMDCDTIVDEHVEGKIGAMQWILCPTMDNTRYTATWIDEMTQNWLEVDTDLYNTSSGAYQVWGMIRNIANVLMVVFLSVIIFSQLTGYGIDNYGIKKMLPRLIVMAIVVNLSFYICEIAIDLSNIAGVGLRNMFGSFGNTLGGGENAVEGTTFLGNSIMAIFAAAANSSAAIGAGVTAFTLTASVAVAIIIAVIVLALVILVAVMILFLMLGAREVMIIFCIIVAPLAFAAFILPNTQNLFKKWWDLFKAAIIIFPICGALSGMSYLLRQISYNAQLPVWGIAIAMILPYLGFFLLPMLLKNAIAALGKVGGALTSLGNTVRNGGRAIGQNATRGVQNSQRFKEQQQYAQERRAAQRAQRIHDRLSGRTDLTHRQQSQLRSADDILLAQRKKDMENASRATGDYYSAAMTRQDLDVGNERRSTELYNDSNYSAMMEQHGEIALLNEREKMWSERFADQDKVANATNLRNALAGHDAEQAAAAFTTLDSQGVSETMDELYNANWGSMDAGVRNKLLTRMASSNVDSFKSFAKYRQSGGQKSFKDWMNGAGPVESGVKDATYASHLNDLKEHAMDAYSKDEMEFINKNAANSLRTQLGAQGFGSMLRSAALNSKDPKMQTQAEDMMRKQIESGAMSVSNLGVTAENLGAMRGETMKAIRQGYIDNLQAHGYTAAAAGAEADRLIRSELSSEIAQARSDQRIYNRMNKDVKSMLGI